MKDPTASAEPTAAAGAERGRPHPAGAPEPARWDGIHFPQHLAVSLRKLFETGAYDRACQLLELHAETQGEPPPEVAGWIIAARLYAAGRAESDPAGEGIEGALRHLRIALDHASRSPQALHPRSRERLESVWRLFSGDPDAALAAYPAVPPPSLSPLRAGVERALIALGGAGAAPEVEEQLRFDLAAPWFERDGRTEEEAANLLQLGAECLAALYGRRNMWAEAALWLERTHADPGGRAEALAFAYERLAEAFSAWNPVRSVALWRKALALAPPAGARAGVVRRYACAARAASLRTPDHPMTREMVRQAAAAVERLQGPDQLGLFEVMIHAYVRVGLLREAAELCDRLILRRPGHTLTQVVRALLLLADGEHEAAYDFLVPLAYDSGHPMALRALTLAARAVGLTEERMRRELRFLFEGGRRSGTPASGSLLRGGEGKATPERPTREEVLEALDEALGQALEADGDAGEGAGRAPELAAQVFAGPPLPPLGWWLAPERALSERLEAIL